MQLTKFTDYALRVLLYLGERPDRLGSVNQVAEVHNISRNHLMKIVRHLGQLGIIETIRGRNGGIRLAHQPETINVGRVVRECEETIDLVDCSGCILGNACGLTDALHCAMDAFFAELDKVSLADLLKGPASRSEQCSGNIPG